MNCIMVVLLREETTFEEVQMAYESPEKYAKAFERKAVKAEMKCTAANMAKASFVTTGILSGVTNMFEVFQDKKELAEALHDVGADAIKRSSKGWSNRCCGHGNSI